MKPLSKNGLSQFLNRFNSFRDSELRSTEILTPTALKITLAVQDSARDFNWITITLEFSGVSDAKLIENLKLSHVDMSEGVSLLFHENLFAFAIGKYSNISNITNSICYIKSTSLKYIEGEF